MQCAICGSGDFSDKGKHEHFTLKDCASCGAQFWAPLTHPGIEGRMND